MTIGEMPGRGHPVLDLPISDVGAAYDQPQMAEVFRRGHLCGHALC